MTLYCTHASCRTDTLLELGHLMRRHSREERVKVFTQVLTKSVRCRHVPRDPNIPFAQGEMPC